MQILINLFISAIAVFVTAYILPGITLAHFSVAFVVAVFIALVNVFVKPLFIFFTLPITILTLGLFLLVINALMILLVAAIVPGFDVKNFWWALLFSLILSLVTSILNSAFK